MRKMILTALAACMLLGGGAAMAADSVYRVIVTIKSGDATVQQLQSRAAFESEEACKAYVSDDEGFKAALAKLVAAVAEGLGDAAKVEFACGPVAE